MEKITPKEIRPENTRYIYFTIADGVPDGSVIAYWADNEMRSVELGWYADSLPIMQRFLVSNPDIRLVLIPSFFHPEIADVLYLYWNDGSNLDELDVKVEQDNFTDVDFRNSIKARYQKTRCTVCGDEWDTLVVDTGDPYFGAPGLLQEKETRFSILHCPNCGTMFRIFVVKILS